MVIGLLQASISIPQAQSLKDKRMVMRSMKDRMMNKMNISVAEVDHQDVWKSAVIAVVTVAAQKDVVEKRLAGVSEFIRSNPEIVLIDYSVDML